MSFRFDARAALERIRTSGSLHPTPPSPPTEAADSGRTVGRIGSVGPTQAEIDALPEELRDAWEERAAIMEHDAHLPRDEAERLALLDVLGRLQ